MHFYQRTLRYAKDAYCPLYHLSYYFSKGPANDPDKKMLLDFKANEEHALRHYILNTLDGLKHLHLDEMLVILRALSSNETRQETSLSLPLDRLGDSIALVYGCSYYPSIVNKTRPTKPVKTLNLRERMVEMQNVYQVDPNYLNLNERPVMIIDDVVTTGATAGALINAVIKNFPRANVSVLSMAWTPAPEQQKYLLDHKHAANILRDQEHPYGWRTSTWPDNEFLNGETNVSVFGS